MLRGGPRCLRIWVPPSTAHWMLGASYAQPSAVVLHPAAHAEPFSTSSARRRSQRVDRSSDGQPFEAPEATPVHAMSSNELHGLDAVGRIENIDGPDVLVLAVAGKSADAARAGKRALDVRRM